MKFDAIIVGGSFAGIATAAQLRGKVLLLDRKEIGTGQTSACATILSVVESLGAIDSVLQIHDSLSITVGPRVLRYKLPYPFCTFDYRRMCEILLNRVDAEVTVARAKDFDGSAVITNRGRFESDIFVDASGWRATLASALRSGYVNRRALSFGLETVVPYRSEGLQFWVDRKRLGNGVTWVFPCGEFSRVGVGSYEGRTDLKEKLEQFLSSLGLKIGQELHGGFFPWALREPVVDNVFVAGDAAGHCFGLTGEGIRPSLYFGQACGQFVQEVVDGKCDLAGALAQYKAFVNRHRIYFKAMLTFQRYLPHFPGLGLYIIGRVFAIGPIFAPLMWQYWKASDPSVLSNPLPQRLAEPGLKGQP